MTGINKEYVPRTAIIRGYYATSAAFGGDVVDSALQFNRWLHAHDAEIRAAALAGSQGELAAAWDEGHLTSRKRGPSGCKCGAWSNGECACGLYGTGAVLSLAANPYRTNA